MFISVHLPVKVYRSENGDWKYENSKHISTEALYASRSKFGSRLLFVGSCLAIGASVADKVLIEKMLLEIDCVPVFQDELPSFDAYLDFCQAFLWPVMNNQLPLMEDTEILQWDENLWKSYKLANELFSTKVMTLLGGGDNYTCLWVNDFHLFLLPGMLRRKLSFAASGSRFASSNSLYASPPLAPISSSLISTKVSIGTFIHTAYPTSEIFLTLPVRSEIMRGLLASDLIGFQFYDYTRHFFSSAQRLFGVRATCQKGGLLALEVSEERNVFIHITHNCIEQEYIVEEASDREVQIRASRIRELNHGKIIIGSVDKLGRTSGILLKIRAFRQFLSVYSQYHDQLVLVLYIVARGSQTTTPEHFAIAREAQALSEEINAEFGPGHIVIKTGIDQFDRCALLCVTDILLETSLKDGLNLVPFEYLAARDAFLRLEGTLANISNIHTLPMSDLPTDEESFGNSLVTNCRKTGRIIISEFTGSSQVLPGAIRINPWNIDSILTALDESLTIPLSMAHASFTRDTNYVASQSQVNWAREFSTQIVRAAIATAATSRLEDWHIDASPRTMEPAAYTALPKLNADTVTNAFSRAKTRLLFLDNEGTLAPNLSRLYRHYGTVSLLQSRGTGPSEEVINVLCSLTSNVCNIVMILSGRAQEPLSLWFDSVPQIGLAAEHGYYWTLPRLTGNDNWRCLIPDSGPATWISPTREIMNRYVNRTPNSYIEDKGSACVWQFRDAEAEFGPAQAKELHAELEISLRNENVDITTGKGYVEVKIRGVNKGRAVEHILKSLREEANIIPDFILCVGDDRSDESMFEKLLAPFPGSETCTIFTSTVGRKKSLAKYFLSDVDHVSTLLTGLANAPEQAVS